MFWNQYSGFYWVQTSKQTWCWWFPLFLQSLPDPAPESELRRMILLLYCLLFTDKQQPSLLLQLLHSSGNLSLGYIKFSIHITVCQSHCLCFVASYDLKIIILYHFGRNSFLVKFKMLKSHLNLHEMKCQTGNILCVKVMV